MTNDEWRMANSELCGTCPFVASWLRGSVALMVCATATVTCCLAGSKSAFELVAQPDGLAFHVAKVVTMDGRERVLNDAIVLVRDDKIEAVGSASEIEVPDGYRRFDFTDHWLAPGLVEAHNHTSGTLPDLNDMVYLTNPGLDTLPTIAPQNDRIKSARTGGVTTTMLIPGSGTNLSGFGTLTKTAGKTVDDVVIRTPGSLKIAQAGNPEWYFGGVRRRFMNWNTRQTLIKARAYHERWLAYENGETKQEPQFDPIWDGFRGLFRHEYPTTVHTQIYQVLLASVDMLVQGFRLWTILDHCTFDAWKLGPIVRETNAWVINGPREYHFDRTARRMIGNCHGWAKNGVERLAVNTDAPVVPERELSYQAAMACWYGWTPQAALKGVTRVPARALGLDDRLGSIEPGKDADLAIWTGNPIDPRSACVLTIVDGKVAYDAAGREGRRRF
jgi:imidazolonepropionase-like amidohydrolase